MEEQIDAIAEDTVELVGEVIEENCLSDVPDYDRGKYSVIPGMLGASAIGAGLVIGVHYLSKFISKQIDMHMLHNKQYCEVNAELENETKTE